MKTKLFPVLLLLISLFGCNDENLSPEGSVEGTYELLYKQKQSLGGEEFYFYFTIELRSDGTFSREEVTRDFSSDEVLGFKYYSNGTYVLSDGIVTLYYEESYSVGIEDVYYLPKEQLTFYDPEGYSDQYKIVNNYTQLEYICPVNALCIANLNYKKID